jgi:hypothetical protein
MQVNMTVAGALEETARAAIVRARDQDPSPVARDNAKQTLERLK